MGAKDAEGGGDAIADAAFVWRLDSEQSARA